MADQLNPDGLSPIKFAIFSKRGLDDPLVAAVSQSRDRLGSAREQYLEALRRSYLPDVGDYAYDNFETAIARATTTGVDDEHAKYRALSGTFSDAMKIIATIAAEPVKLTSNIH